MRQARVLGSYIRQLAKENNVTDTELSEILDCKPYQITALMQGRLIPSFDQLSILAKRFNISVLELLHGDSEQYDDINASFSNPSNKDIILDIIDDYLDICYLG